MENKDELLSIIEIDLRKVAWSSLIATILLSLLGLFTYYSLYNELDITFSIVNMLFFFLGYVLLIILHEIFHLIGFKYFGKAPWKSMKYGLNLKEGIAYATTSIPLPNKAMKQALLLPFWMTGVVPMLAGFMIKSPGLILLGAWLIAGAAGDFAMYKELKKYPPDLLIKDDPIKPKLYVLKKESGQHD